MKNFSEITNNTIIVEKRMDKSFIEFYFKKYSKDMPSNVVSIMNLSIKYDITDPKIIDKIRSSNKPALSKLVDKLNIPIDDLVMFWNKLRELKDDVKFLPQYLNQKEVAAVEQGKLKYQDLTLDLKTSAGRNAVTKTYMPVVYKVISNFTNRSNFDKSDLLSAAMEGFSDALNEYDITKGLPFKTYAGFRVRQAILNDINANSHAFSGTSSYSATKGDNFDAASLETMFGDGETAMDKLGALAYHDPTMKLTPKEEDQWQSLFNILEKKFSQRDMDIFYRFFGLNGYEREKSKDIAKSYGMSIGNIRNSVINKIIAFLKRDSKSIDILANLQDIYTESLMVELCGNSREVIMDTLINDDTYILLEELNRWRYDFESYLHNALKNVQDKAGLIELLTSDLLYTEFKKHKADVVSFLGYMYPQEKIKLNNDNYLIDMMLMIKNQIMYLQLEDSLKELK